MTKIIRKSHSQHVLVFRVISMYELQMRLVVTDAAMRALSRHGIYHARLRVLDYCSSWWLSFHF